MKEIEDILARINRMGKQELWRDNSPIWARPQADFYRMFRDDLFYPKVPSFYTKDYVGTGTSISS